MMKQSVEQNAKAQRQERAEQSVKKLNSIEPGHGQGEQ